MRVLVLGSRGMVGHVMTAHLEEQGGFDVVNIARAQPFNDKSVLLDLRRAEEISTFLGQHPFDVVINCAGILNRHADADVCSALLVNSYLPRYLERRFRDTATRILHISTDCVFSGARGGYIESDLADGDTIYARTKKLGELNNGKDLTLRLSVVGPELRPEGTGLFNWFMAQKTPVPGYTKVFWTGLTTVELARQITVILAERKDLTGLYHLVPGEKVAKHDLLLLFNRYFREGRVLIRPDDRERSDRSLVDTRREAGCPVPSYEQMIAEMKAWVDAHRAWYPHYG